MTDEDKDNINKLLNEGFNERYTNPQEYTLYWGVGMREEFERVFKEWIEDEDLQRREL